MNEKQDKQVVSLHISTGTLFKIGIFIMCTLFAYQLRGLILIILSAVVIASVIEPGTKWLTRRGVQRVFAASLMYLIIVGIIVSIFTFIVPPLFTESISAVNNLPKYIKTIDLLSPFHKGTFSSVKTFFPDLPNTISVGDLASTFTSTISDFSGGLFDTVTGFFGGIISLLLVVVISFYLSVREDGVGEFLAIVTPLKHEKYIRDLWRRSENKIGKWMQGQLLLGLFVGILTYIALLIVGVKHSLVLAFLACIFELIPVVGIALAALPAFFLATLDGGLGLGLIVIAIYLFIQQIEAHLVYPLVVKKIIGVPPLLVIIALVAGAELAGFVGALLAIPVAVGLMEFIDDVERKKRFVSEPVVVE